MVRSRSVPLLLLCFAINVSADTTDDYISSEMERRRIPGLCLAVVRDGKVVKERGYGFANLELKAPVTTNTVFEIGSITKQFTAAVVMLLVAEGKVALDDAIESHLKDLPETWRGITIRQLLTHTSGLKNYTGLDGFEVRRKLDRDAFMRELAKEPLDFPRGEKFSYCNSGYNLLGYIIEHKTGTSYWAVLRERILSPLRMDKTRDRDPRTIIANRAAGYELAKDDLVNRDSDLTDVFAAGAMVSTVGDLVKWNAALDGDALLSRKSRDEMWTAINLNNGTPYPYGLGWRLDDYSGRPNVGHSGSTSGFSASLQRFPQERLTVILLCNLGEQGVATKLARGVADLYFKSSGEAGGETKP
jgi:D-alanyl-D-alanine carboxypeptidase